MKILTVPAETEILRRKSQPIEKIDAELLAFLEELGETLKGQKDPAGVGLSAIQVGRQIRAFAMLLPEQRTKAEGRRTKVKSTLQFYINPEIMEHSEEMTLGYDLVPTRLPLDVPDGTSLAMTMPYKRINASTHQPFLEGCLSIPRIYGSVLRYPWVKAKATVFFPASRAGGLLPSSFTLDALAARVFQHEVDHLNGILFTDHVLAQGNQLYREEEKELVEMEM